MRSNEFCNPCYFRFNRSTIKSKKDRLSNSDLMSRDFLQADTKIRPQRGGAKKRQHSEEEDEEEEDEFEEDEEEEDEESDSDMGKKLKRKRRSKKDDDEKEDEEDEDSDDNSYNETGETQKEYTVSRRIVINVPIACTPKRSLNH